MGERNIAQSMECGSSGFVTSIQEICYMLTLPKVVAVLLSATLINTDGTRDKISTTVEEMTDSATRTIESTPGTA